MISIHPTALVASSRIGDGTRIWAFVNVLEGATIGRDCNICDRCFVENDVVVGDRVTVKSGVSLWDGVRLEDDVFVGPGATFANDFRPRSGIRFASHPETFVRIGASLGSAAVVLPGLTIGRWAMVGAGAVVTRDVEEFALVYGNPARPRGWVCRCARTLLFDDDGARCGCGRRFRREGPARIREESA